MKTYFIFLCLLISGGFASATTQNTADQDKPARLYVKSYSMGDSGFYFYENGGTTVDMPFQGNANWSGDGSAGTGSWTAQEEGTGVDPSVTSVNASWYWPASSSWPNLSATLIETYYDSIESPCPYTSTNNNQTPPVFLEHCDINIATNVLGNDGLKVQTMERRAAQMTMKLQTGGKAMSQVRNLFGIGGGGNKIIPNNPFESASPHDDEFGYLFERTGGASIPPQSITIGSLGNLGSDGNLYVALPDNADVDVTPSASVAGVDYYQFGVGEQKYKLTISANTNDLSDTTPEFCVGQQVNLKAAWSPSLPSGTQTNYQWIASLDFIDKIVPPATNEASTNYVLDLTLMTNNPAPVWWYSGGYKYLWCNVNCRFSNGQTAAVIGEGNLSIFRPSVQFLAGSPAAPMLADGFLELGNVDNISNMTFAAQVTSKTNFPGLANWTQLNERAVTLPFDSTYGEYWLDNDQFYNNGVGACVHNC
jgi:hypothetical protein